MNVVYALTRNYYEKLIPSITSLHDFNPEARVFIVCEDDEFPLELPFDAEIVNVSDQTWFPKSGVNYNNGFTYINLLKVCYSSLFKVNKIIHLDVDTIMNDCLDQLWRTDIRNKWFAAVPETLGWYKPFGDKYYNMGVALINLQQMRKDKIEPVLVEYLNTVKQPWADQDAWNKFGIENDMIVDLPIKFNENMMTGFTDHPTIVHYCAISDWFENHNVSRHEYLDKYR